MKQLEVSVQGLTRITKTIIVKSTWNVISLALYYYNSKEWYAQNAEVKNNDCLYNWLIITRIAFDIYSQYSMKKVCYLYNEDITKYELSKEHPMKTKRMKMVHSLISNYSLAPQLKMYHAKEASSEEMCHFHHPQYVKYLETWVSPKALPIV